MFGRTGAPPVTSSSDRALDVVFLGGLGLLLLVMVAGLVLVAP
ncbi:MAG TPA: hypothetical protein VM367_09425 [Pseudonocardia sp.]|jgi:hypothetical protein|nr:hypothetical protein [Pseudonocardia sp.]